MKKLFLLLSTILLLAIESNATIWNVGATQTYTLPSQIRMLVQDDKNGIYFVYIKTSQGTTTQKLIVNR